MSVKNVFISKQGYLMITVKVISPSLLLLSLNLFLYLSFNHKGHRGHEEGSGAYRLKDGPG